jgi:hypothetical protein
MYEFNIRKKNIWDDNNELVIRKCGKTIIQLGKYQ